MHARLVTILALAAVISPTACGQSELEQAGAELLTRDVAAEAPPVPNGAAAPHAERHDALPASFPHDIPIPAGLTAKSVASEQAGSYAAIFTGDLEPEAVYRFFAEHLVAEGWTIDKAQGTGVALALFASKGERLASIISTRIDGQLHVELGVNGGL